MELEGRRERGAVRERAAEKVVDAAASVENHGVRPRVAQQLLLVAVAERRHHRARHIYRVDLAPDRLVLRYHAAHLGAQRGAVLSGQLALRRLVEIRVEHRLREVQPLIKNISNYQRLKPVYDAYMKAADKPAYRAKHEAELVIYEAAKSILLAIQGDGKLPSLKSLQAEQQRLVDEQQRLYDERAKLKKEARLIDTMKANVDDFLSPSLAKEQEKSRSGELE